MVLHIDISTSRIVYNVHSTLGDLQLSLYACCATHLTFFTPLNCINIARYFILHCVYPVTGKLHSKDIALSLNYLLQSTHCRLQHLHTHSCLCIKHSLTETLHTWRSHYNSLRLSAYISHAYISLQADIDVRPTYSITTCTVYACHCECVHACLDDYNRLKWRARVPTPSLGKVQVKVLRGRVEVVPRPGRPRCRCLGPAP
jgi:hypothetical protein